jgi:hypothetical protein
MKRNESSFVSLHVTVAVAKHLALLMLVWIFSQSRPVEHKVIYILCFLLILEKNLRSSVDVATGYGLDNRGFDSRRGAGNFSFLHRVHTGSGTHPTSYPMGNGGSFTGGKATGA